MIARNLKDNEMTDTQIQTTRSTPKAPGKNTNPDPKNRYSVPELIRRVFDQFPLVTYKENPVPQRARRRNDKHALYIFLNVFDASGSGLSCNPTCLKWQTYLRLNDIEFTVIGSNNHASPSGSLPFLLPASSSNDPRPLPLSTGKFPRWVSQQVMQEVETVNTQHEAYMATIDHNIRNGWLYHLYLIQSNFDSVAFPLYVSTASSNPFVQRSIAYQLREAAQSELLKSMHIIDGEEIYAAVAKGFRALSTLIGPRQFYSRVDGPGLFDASVFAYTHLILDESLPWKDDRLSDMLHGYPSLVQHRDRMLEMYNRP